MDVVCKKDATAVPPSSREAIRTVSSVGTSASDFLVSEHEEEEEVFKDDESEYSYEDEDDTHYGGFILPVVQPATQEEESSVARIVEQDDDDDDDVVEEEDDETANKAATTASSSKWVEPSRQAIDMSLRAERETTGGKRRLAADLYKIMMRDTADAGFSLEPKDEDCMDKWIIRLFQFDEDSFLSQDLLALGLDHVELEMSFPDQYPFAPPFVRVVSPRFKRQTGFVMNGALCMELLTSEGWNPVNDIESVIVSIRSLLVVGEGRLQAAVDMPEEKRKAAIQANKQKRMDGEKKPASSGEQGPPWKKQKQDKNNSSPKPKVGQYTVAEAEAAYSHLTDYHKKKGWDSYGWWAKKG